MYRSVKTTTVGFVSFSAINMMLKWKIRHSDVCEVNMCIFEYEANDDCACLCKFDMDFVL